MVRQNDMKTEMKDWCDHQSFVQEKWRDTIQWQNVCEISNLLIQYLNEKEIAAQISVANQNNMDFLDFWKCHICKYAHYLFLLVPKELRQNQSGKIVGRPYQTVVSHMETLFYPENYTSVRGVVVIGY